jgi:hypothetical protein
MVTRHLIDRLSERIERLQPRGRIFSMGMVQDHRNADAEFAAFRKDHGLSDRDVVTAMCTVPWEDRQADWNKRERTRKPRRPFYKGNVLLQIQFVRPQRQWSPADFEPAMSAPLSKKK